jgi:hypothetical protein
MVTDNILITDIPINKGKRSTKHLVIKEFS